MFIFYLTGKCSSEILIKQVENSLENAETNNLESRTKTTPSAIFVKDSSETVPLDVIGNKISDTVSGSLNEAMSKFHSESSTAEHQSERFQNVESRTMKHVFDAFNDKMEFYTAFHANELSLLRNTLNSLKDKMRVFDVLHGKVEQLIDQQNIAQQKLHVIVEAVVGGESMNSKLNRMEYSLQYLHSRIDELITKQNSKNDIDDQLKSENVYITASVSNEQMSSCETKVDQLISFVHNFAELNRLESTDILNRLGNMQSQLINFFDLSKEVGANHRAQNVKITKKSENSSESTGFHAKESPIVPINATEMPRNSDKGLESPIAANIMSTEQKRIINKVRFPHFQ